MITVKNLSKHFGGIKAVDGVDLHIDKGSITGLVGPNGAGKTTMFNLIAGLYQPTEGEIIPVSYTHLTLPTILLV